jgi:hypothetical protein
MPRRILLVALILTALTTRAQQSLERFERTLEQFRRETITNRIDAIPPAQRALIDYGAYLSFGYFSIDDRFHDNHILRQYELFPYARFSLDNAQEVFVRGRMGYRDFNDRDSFDGRGDELIDPDLDRGYYRFDLKNYRSAKGAAPADYNITFEAGRDLAYWANGLVLAQTLDGGFLNLSCNNLELGLVAGITPTRTFDFDASRPSFDFNTRRGFFGGILSARLGTHRPFVYFLSQLDYNRDKTFIVQNGDPDNRITTRFAYDSYYLGMGSTGTIGDRLAYGAEFVLEGGRGLSNSFELVSTGEGSVAPAPLRQRNDWIRAFAFDFKLDYLLPDPGKTRLSAELVIASGDRDRQSTSNTFGGNRPGTDDHAFNAFGLLNTGLAFAPPVSNLLAVRLGASTSPLPQGDPWERLQLGTDLFLFAKLTRSAPIDEPTSDDRYLGFEPDVFMNWQITNDVTLAARYGIFIPGSAITGDDRPRQVFFLGVTYGF